MLWLRRLSPAIGFVFAATLLVLCVDLLRPALLIVGPVTIDDINGNRTVLRDLMQTCLFSMITT